MGSDNVIHEHAVLGGPPQHASASPPFGEVRLGDGNVVREYATINCALRQGESTTFGSHNYLMTGAHVGHDCRIGGHCILGNNLLLGGHVEVGDRAFVAAATAVHQFCRIGGYAMVGGQAHVVQDVPPYVTVDGLSSRVVGLNSVGLRRAGFDAEAIAQLKAAYRLLYRSGMKWDDMMAALKSEFPAGPAAAFHPFLVASKRGILAARRRPRSHAVTLPHPGAAESDAAPLRKAG